MSKLILIIEDDVGILTFLEDALSFEGYRVHGLTHWEQDSGAALLQEIQPDLVITDMLVEGQMTGLKIINQLRQQTFTADLPVLLCTAISHVRIEVENAFGAEIERNKIKVLYKPFDLDELLDLVEQLLANETVTK